MSPREFVEAGYADVQALSDVGTQMHRRSVRGRPLVVHVHAWDATANGRNGGMPVTLRVDGQYVDRGERYRAPTRSDAGRFADEVRALLAGMEPPVPGEPYDGRGGPGRGQGRKSRGTVETAPLSIRVLPSEREDFRIVGHAEIRRLVTRRAARMRKSAGG